MRILSFDQSLNFTAVAVLEEAPDDKVQVSSAFVFRPKSTGIYRLVNVMEFMHRMIDENKPHIIAREMHNQRQFGNAGSLQAVAGVLDILAYKSGYVKDSNYYSISSGTWKKFITGKGNLKKDTAYLMKLNSSFRNCRFFNFIGDNIEDDNIADAIGIGISAYVAHRLRTFSLLPFDQKDLRDLRSSISGMTSYGEEK